MWALYYAFSVAIYNMLPNSQIHVVSADKTVDINVTAGFSSNFNADLIKAINDKNQISHPDWKPIFEDTVISEKAQKWTDTKPTAFKENECDYAQNGLLLWQKSNDKVFRNLSYSTFAAQFVNNFAAYYCNPFKYFDDETMKHLKKTDVGIGRTAAVMNNTRGTGPLIGVGIWVFLFYVAPDSYQPDKYTQTPPTEPFSGQPTTQAPNNTNASTTPVSTTPASTKLPTTVVTTDAPITTEPTEEPPTTTIASTTKASKENETDNEEEKEEEEEVEENE